METEIQKLIDHPEAIRETLHIAELDAMIHEIFPMLKFEMDYRIEMGKRAQRPFFIAECGEDMTDATGIFAQVLRECKINTFNTVIQWKENEGYKVWFTLDLTYSHFDGGRNGMQIAEFRYQNGEWTMHHCKDERKGE